MYIYIYTNSLLNCMYKIDIETRTSCHLLPLHRTWPLHTAPSFEEILGRSRPGSRSLQKQLALECRRMRRPITGSIAASVQRAGHFSPESPLTILHNCSCFDSVILGVGVTWVTAVRFSHAKCQDMNRRIALLPSFAFGTGSTSLSLSVKPKGRGHEKRFEQESRNKMPCPYL